ncbi:MAG TPA: translation initiation factor IF-5A [Thermoplasmata archaeon]|nr:translation initiation factor IF-5A [Thermoplasmata archaeon]
MAWTQQEIRELREGRYMLIDEEPCRILSIQMSKPGKHGEAKARIDAVGLFDLRKRSVVFPVTHKVQVPLIGKRNAQVLSMTDTEVQLMDLESYETFSLAVDPETKAAVTPGGEVQYLDAMGRRKITRT